MKKLGAIGFVSTCFLSGALVVGAPRPVLSRADSAAQEKPAQVQRDRGGQHDFDFEFGSWKVRLKRLVRPMSGSDEWVDMEGTSVVRKVWDGRANLGELNVSNPDGRIQGLSLRLYNPESKQWNIYWANARDGQLGTAMIGQFANGRGVFFNQEMFQGRAIYVRFIFSDITPDAFRLEQAFSADGGSTWEPNWIASFVREEP